MTKHKIQLWRCPNCGREFVKANQAHSCGRSSVESHFEFKDSQLSETFELLLANLKKLGPLRIDAVRSSINLISKYHFGGVQVHRDHLTIGFLSQRTINDKRIHRAEKVGAQKFIHFVKVRMPHEVDKKLMGWLANAYRLQSK
jgi:hypothetical protein